MRNLERFGLHLVHCALWQPCSLCSTSSAICARRHVPRGRPSADAHSSKHQGMLSACDVMMMLCIIAIGSCVQQPQPDVVSKTLLRVPEAVQTARSC